MLNALVLFVLLLARMFDIASNGYHRQLDRVEFAALLLVGNAAEN